MKNLYKSFKILKIPPKDKYKLEHEEYLKKLKLYYSKYISLTVENIKTGVSDSKLEFFITLLTETNTIPNYLMSDLSKSNRTILTKFRTSSHMLNIEKREIYKTPKQQEKIGYVIFVWIKE